VPSLLQKMLAQGTLTEPVEPEHSVEQQAYLQLLADLMAPALTDRQRRAIIGVHWQGRSMKEVTVVLGLNRNTLHKLLHDGPPAPKGGTGGAVSHRGRYSGGL
jgi:DNA-directed RNA polymerase specialized sigma24 family protein